MCIAYAGRLCICEVGSMSEQNKSKGGCNTSSVLVDDALDSVDSRVDAYVVI